MRAIMLCERVAVVIERARFSLLTTAILMAASIAISETMNEYDRLVLLFKSADVRRRRNNGVTVVVKRFWLLTDMSTAPSF